MNYAALRSQIQADLTNRVDITNAVVDTEVAQRVYYYNAENFGQMTTIDFSIVTTPGVTSYPLPQYTVDVTGMWYLLGGGPGGSGGTWIRLDPENYEVLVDWNNIQPVIQSPMNNYSIYGDLFDLYPTPDNEYPLKIVCTKQIPAPSSPSDINFWTQEAFALIRYATDAALARAYLAVPSMADEYDSLASRELSRLLMETDFKQSTNKVQGHMI